VQEYPMYTIPVLVDLHNNQKICIYIYTIYLYIYIQYINMYMNIYQMILQSHIYT
jgi:hypothetical protein